jgi:tetratricopeptide (TPR) repeat protein
MRSARREPDSDPNGVLMSLGLWDAADTLRDLTVRDPALAEAHLRLGQVYVRLARPREALLSLVQAEQSATTPYVRYLSRLLSGAVAERVGRRAEAIRAFRGALEVIPRAQSATLALAPLLFMEGEREEAADLLEAALRPQLPFDPLQSYWDRDPERWTAYLPNLRQALR